MVTILDLDILSLAYMASVRKGWSFVFVGNQIWKINLDMKNTTFGLLHIRFHDLKVQCCTQLLKVCKLIEINRMYTVVLNVVVLSQPMESNVNKQVLHI